MTDFKVSAPIGNYYGSPYVVVREGKYYFGIQDYVGNKEIEVSGGFYDSLVAEFDGADDENVITVYD